MVILDFEDGIPTESDSIAFELGDDICVRSSGSDSRSLKYPRDSVSGRMDDRKIC